MARIPRPGDNVLRLTEAGRRHVLHDAIYLSLRQALQNGEFSPGQALSLRALAERFGTSLIPVRDALKRLVAEGVLVALANRTICVPLMTRASFQELLQVRLSLEPELARRATEFISYETIVELEAINSEMQEAACRGAAGRYLASNYAFHFKLYSCSESIVALPIVHGLWGQAGPFLNAVFNLKGANAAKDHHGEVLRSLRRRDGLRVANAIADDLGEAADLVLARADFVCDERAAAMDAARRSRLI